MGDLTDDDTAPLPSISSEPWEAIGGEPLQPFTRFLNQLSRGEGQPDDLRNARAGHRQSIRLPLGRPRKRHGRPSDRGCMPGMALIV